MAAYGDWTDRINGLGLGADVEPDREPAEWNAEFYILLAEHLLDADEPVFEAEVRRVTDLPDNTFGNVAPAVLQAADALYFNNAERDPGRPVALRTRFGARAMILRRWQYERDPGRASVDLESGEIVAKMFLNNYNPFGRTASYLPIAVFDRVDPLPEPLRPLLAGGPTSTRPKRRRAFPGYRLLVAAVKPTVCSSSAPLIFALLVFTGPLMMSGPRFPRARPQGNPFPFGIRQWSRSIGWYLRTRGICALPQRRDQRASHGRRVHGLPAAP